MSQVSRKEKLVAKKTTAQAWEGNVQSVVTFYGSGESAFAVAAALLKKAKGIEATSITLSVDYLGEPDDAFAGAVFIVL